MKYKSGDRVGSMTLLNMHTKVSYGANIWEVVCDCGTTSYKRTSDFWKLQSCGYRCPLHATIARRYPKRSRKEQLAWHDMKSRCLNSSNPAYPSYGGRGITIHPEWIVSFSAFYDCIGAAPSGAYSVDRIDNNKGYEPGNVRWATKKEQNNNKRCSVLLTANGQTKTIAQWAEYLNVPYSKLYWRYTHGWAHEDIVNKP